MAVTTVVGLDLTGRGIRIEMDEGIITDLQPAHVPQGAPILTPGLVDLQVNGFAGHDVNGPEVTPGEVVAMVRALAAVGTTTVVPTVITGSAEDISRSLAAISTACLDDEGTAASIPWVHLEGPYISAAEGPRGAHDLDQIRSPDLAELDAWQRAADGMVGMITLSPHHPNTADFIRQAVARGIRVAIGHTHAEPGQIRAAVDAGARFSTHLGNGIQAMLPRHPNAMWTQLADDRLAAGFIADGHHLPDDTLLAMLRAKGSARSYVVSDSVALAGSMPGPYTTPVGGQVELHADGRLCVADTAYLAGAALPLVQALSTLHRIGLSAHHAFQLTSTNPGRIAGRGGHLAIGQRANVLEVSWAEGGVEVHRIWWGGVDQAVPVTPA